MPIISYAQNFEDVLLNRLFPESQSGFYIDIGACHPIDHSVTKLFYERGWHGINVEPIPALWAALAEDRKRDINLHLGLSNREGTFTFYECPNEVGSSTFSEDQAAVLRRAGHQLVERAIPVTTLARVCDQYATRAIDFLKIDVESHEREVLEGADWSRFRPRVVLVEATQPATSIPSYAHWEPLLLSASYLFAFFDGLNRYYVRAEDRELLPALAVPANVFDRFEVHAHNRQIQELSNALKAMQESYESTQRALIDTRSAFVEAQLAVVGLGRKLTDSQHELLELRVRFEAAQTRFAPFHELGPVSIGIARTLHRLSERSPRLASLARRAIRCARSLGRAPVTTA
jgi:FkbM family methyltransferase